MTGILVEGDIWAETCTREEERMTMKTDMGVRHPQPAGIKDCHQTTRNQDRGLGHILPRGEPASPTHTLISALQLPDPETTEFCSFHQRPNFQHFNCQNRRQAPTSD